MRRVPSVAAVLIATVMLTGACSSTPAPTSASSRCPTEAVSVVVTVDQWGDIVDQLAGDCGEVTTIIEGSVDDPHSYEPTAADTAEFTAADLVVMNGLGYDPWAADAVETLSPQPAVVNGGEVVGLEEGDNPHIWYGPDYVTLAAEAVTTELKTLAPEAADYFDEQAQAWTMSMQPYFDEITSIKQAHSSARFASTESIFDYMTEALGMQNLTPQGYQNAAGNASDPAPGDVNEFEQLLRGGTADVLIYNVQTEGAVPQQLRSVADAAGVPVVEVTETVARGATSFVEWQLVQLEALSAALSS
jgi:zinc/manganese transport system substrate-binding protein